MVELVGLGALRARREACAGECRRRAGRAARSARGRARRARDRQRAFLRAAVRDPRPPARHEPPARHRVDRHREARGLDPRRDEALPARASAAPARARPRDHAGHRSPGARRLRRHGHARHRPRGGKPVVLRHRPAPGARERRDARMLARARRGGVPRRAGLARRPGRDHPRAPGPRARLSAARAHLERRLRGVHGAARVAHRVEPPLRVLLVPGPVDVRDAPDLPAARRVWHEVA